MIGIKKTVNKHIKMSASSFVFLKHLKISRFNTTPIKISDGFFVETDKLILKIHMDSE